MRVWINSGWANSHPGIVNRVVRLLKQDETERRILRTYSKALGIQEYKEINISLGSGFVIIFHKVLGDSRDYAVVRVDIARKCPIHKRRNFAFSLEQVGRIFDLEDAEPLSVLDLPRSTTITFMPTKGELEKMNRQLQNIVKRGRRRDCVEA